MGQKLFAEFASWISNKGENSCMAWVLENSPFRQFYHKMGAIRLNSTKEIFFSTPEPFKIVAFGWPHLYSDK